jgi:hypothetical protein
MPRAPWLRPSVVLATLCGWLDCGLLPRVLVWYYLRFIIPLHGGELLVSAYRKELESLAIASSGATAKAIRHPALKAELRPALQPAAKPECMPTDLESSSSERAPTQPLRVRLHHFASREYLARVS